MLKRTSGQLAGPDGTPAQRTRLTETSSDIYTELSVAGDIITDSPTDILAAVRVVIKDQNPDVLVYSTSEIIPTLYKTAAITGVNKFTLSRLPDVGY